MLEVSIAEAPDRPDAASVTVLFFGKLADAMGRSAEVAIPAAGCTVAQLKTHLAATIAGAEAALAERGVRWAVAREIVGDHAWVRPGQEVAFFSMFSGG